MKSVTVDPLLCRLGVHAFEEVLSARAETVGSLRASVDGGAGWGETTTAMVKWTVPDGVVFAFEPFPGNHRFFEGLDPRIQLVKSAIAAAPGTSAFFVASTVSTQDAWADKGLVGYSSLGRLPGGTRLAARMRDWWAHVCRRSGDPRWIDVEVVRMDQVVRVGHLDFVKLDLQGGEPAALAGMGRLLDQTDLLWIEFSDQPGLLELMMRDHGFLAFDTDNYLSLNASDDALAAAGLAPSRQIMLSISRPATMARRIADTADYRRWYAQARRAGVIQTDLLFVNPRFEPEFRRLAQRLEHRRGELR